MGGIYAREAGEPEAVWKAIYHHYLPVGVEAERRRRRAQLGAAAVTWAAVSLADKLDTLVGLFLAASGRPARAIRSGCGGRRTGCSHPGRPAGADGPAPSGPTLGALIAAAERDLPLERGRARGADGVPDRAAEVRPRAARRRRAQRPRRARRPAAAPASPARGAPHARALPEFTGTPEFRQLATAFKRVQEHRARAGVRPASGRGPDALTARCRSRPRSRSSPSSSAASRSSSACASPATTTGRPTPRLRSSAGRGPVLRRSVRDGGRPRAAAGAAAR